MATGSIWKILRSLTLGNRPSGRAYGEPYVNFAENQFGVINSSGAAQDLIGTPIFSTTANYSVGQSVNRSGIIYTALVAVSAGAWNPAQWSQVASQNFVTGQVPPTVIPSGTQMLFIQNAAPTGWTRNSNSAIDDSLLRIVASATPAYGGATAFSAFNATTTTGNFTISQGYLPNYNMPTSFVVFNSVTGTQTGLTASAPGGTYGIIQGSLTAALSGSGSAHSHSITTNIKYVDSLIATKN